MYRSCCLLPASLLCRTVHKRLAECQFIYLKIDGTADMLIYLTSSVSISLEVHATTYITAMILYGRLGETRHFFGRGGLQ